MKKKLLVGKCSICCKKILSDERKYVAFVINVESMDNAATVTIHNTHFLNLMHLDCFKMLPLPQENCEQVESFSDE